MANLAPLPEHDRRFAATDARQHAPQLPFLSRAGLFIVCCMDCRVDPAERLGLEFGEALVGYNQRMLAALPVTDPAQTVRADVERLLATPQISAHTPVSGHVYDLDTGLITTVVTSTSARPDA